MYTLKPGWTKEKVLAQVKKYNNGRVAKQICPVSGISSCAYQASDGNRCAIGAFLPDHNEHLRYLGSVINLMENAPEIVEYLPFDDDSALLAFQNIHDESHDGAVLKNIELFLKQQVQEPA